MNNELQFPCLVTCYTLEEALRLREALQDELGENEWRRAYGNDRHFDNPFTVKFTAEFKIYSWGQLLDYNVDGYNFICIAEDYIRLITGEDDIGKFSDNNLDDLLAGGEAPERTTNDDFVSSAGACETERVKE